MVADAPPTVTVHAKWHIAAAAEAAIAAGVDLRVLTAPGASVYLGPGWLDPATADAREQMRAAGLTLYAYLDCADRAGDAMAALTEGPPGVLFTGGADVAAKLSAMASALGIPLLTERPDSRDLNGVADVARTCAAMFAAR
jgi:hypothetical protein